MSIDTIDGAAETQPQKRRPQKLSESKAVQESNLARRLHAPVIVTGVDMAKTITIIQPSQFGRLNVDESYQRVRIGNEVNDIIHVIRSGGAIPDPIDVAERPDGSWWILDGQQRYWAHDETKEPLRALIHKVYTHEAESKLFVVFNSRRKVRPIIIVKGWPGPTGDFLRKLNTSPTSPLVGMIDFGNNSKLPLAANNLVRGILTVTTGMSRNSRGGGDAATVLLPRTDAALKVTGRMAWAEAYVQLVAMVFGKSDARVRAMPLQALAEVAHQRYKAAGRVTFPASTELLRRMNWDTCVPKHTDQYYPMMVEKIQRRWRISSRA